MDINLFFQRYSDILAQGNKDAVVAFLLQSIAETEKNASAQVTILNEAAGYFRCISHFEESIGAAERALSLLRGMNYEGTVPYATTLLNAATAYRASGDNLKAMELFIASLSTLKAELEEDDHRIAGLYNNISEIHKEAENYEAALELLHKACTIMAAKPEMEGDYAIVLANLGAVLLDLKRMDESQAALTKAQEVFGRHAEKDGRLAPHYASTLASISEMHYRNGLFKKAAETYEETLANIERCFGENAHFAITCQNCAAAYEAAGNYAKSRAMREKYQSVMKQLNIDTD